MTAIRFRGWKIEIVAPVHVHRAAPTVPAARKASERDSAPRVHHDPTPTPGAFEPPLDLFREIARGGRALE
ncbi:MAG: hypothetical protein CVT64_02145 [Actinobacteria bacterium HGW-Actinobacteria-4]|nr:MAG: hypothetical protein CVT64_02145 [Actinobacteria bacterium HGW-Actinobacteria-4]